MDTKFVPWLELKVVSVPIKFEINWIQDSGVIVLTSKVCGGGGGSGGGGRTIAKPISDEKKIFFAG